MKKHTQQPSRIPHFKSREEAGEFWDTHDFTEYWDELKPVTIHFAKQLSQGVTVRFDPPTLAELRKRAQEKGIGATTLVRMWVLQHLKTA